MTAPDLQSFELTCHPSFAQPAVRRLQVQLGRVSPGTLQLRYVLEAKLTGLRIPELAAPQRKNELWRHTCFEAFIRIGDGPGYYEINLSPSLKWALYRFDSYRQGMSPVAIVNAPAISVSRCDDRLELDAQLPLGDLSELRGDVSLRLALATVIEAEDGSVSYWALEHPTEKPDFHHAGGFAAQSDS